MDSHAYGYWSRGEQRNQPRRGRYAARERRRVGTCRSSVQRDPRYFGEAASYSGNDAVAGSFKYGLRVDVGEFFEYFLKSATLRADHGLVLFHCCRAGPTDVAAKCRKVSTI